MTKDNNLRSRLKAGETLFGLFVAHPSASTVELLAACGYDFLILDGEHGSVQEADMPALALAAEAGNCAPLVRVPSLDRRVIGKYLDFGAAGLMAPMVASRRDVDVLTGSALYPPEGARGVGPTRNIKYGLAKDTLAELQHANESLITIAQIETTEALDALDDILSAPRLDVAFVGPADLSASLGVPMQFGHPDFLAALEKIVKGAHQHQVHLGILVNEPSHISQFHAMGFRFFTGYFDMLMAAANMRFLASCREAAL